MAKLTLDGLTPEQANALESWFCGQGEQDCVLWLEELGVPAPMTNTMHPNYKVIDEDGNVTIQCHTP